MPYSAGVFSRIYNWSVEQASAPIEIAKLDTQEEDVATALSNCLLRDGTGLPTANTDWNGKKITNLGNGSAGGDALNLTTGDARYFSASGSASIATDTLVGRDTAGTGAVESLSVSGGIEFTGSGGIRTSAFTGDVTKTAGGTATTIAADAVTNAKLANMSSATVKGQTSGGSGDPVDLTAAQLVTIINTADGSGSGLDADLLDGQNSTAFAAASHTQTMSTITDLPTLVSGTYSPGVGGTGVSGGSGSATYLRVGSICSVAGQASYTSAGGIVTPTISLPVGSNLTSSYQASGHMMEITADATPPVGGHGAITADTTNDVAIGRFESQSATTYTITFQFQYLIQ